MDEEFGEAMLPLLEIADEEEKVELTKDILNYVAKVMAVHNKRLDDEKIKRALNPVFNEGAENMIPTIFEEKYAEIEVKRRPIWIAEGEARGKAETARKMKQEGFPIDAISRLTGLSVEEIKRLRRKK